MNPERNSAGNTLTDLVALNAADPVIEFLDELSWKERVREIALLSTDDRNTLLTLLDPERAAELVDELPELQAASALESLSPESAADIVEQLSSDQQADIVSQLEDEDAEKILEQMDPEDAASLRALTEYSNDCAGGLMQTEYVSFAPDTTVEAVLSELRANAEDYLRFDIQYIYVVSNNDTPLGIVGLRELLTASMDLPLRSLMQQDLISVRDDASLEELQDRFNEYPLQGFPVLDRLGRIIGVVPRNALEQGLAEKAQKEFRESQGIVGGEELRSLPYQTHLRRRLSWLTVKIALNLVSASVIAAHQDTLAKMVTLAVFLPILSDMSGSAGNQATAVSIRELSLGLIRPMDYLKILYKELQMGLVNGLILSLLLGTLAQAWYNEFPLSLAVGGALFISINVGVMAGGLLPLGLKALKVDPALSSGPILTTITDTCSFFMALTFAAIILNLA